MGNWVVHSVVRKGGKNRGTEVAGDNLEGSDEAAGIGVVAEAEGGPEEVPEEVPEEALGEALEEEALVEMHSDVC